MNELPLEFAAQARTVLSDEVYETLRRAILTRRLPPGSRLVESVIAKQMRVSRAVLREAMRRLEHDGLVLWEPHRGAQVVSLTTEEIKELHLLRAMLETLAYSCAAKRITGEELRQVEEVANHMCAAAEAGDSQRVAELDYTIHDLLVRASSLPRLYRIWSDMHALTQMWLQMVAMYHDQHLTSIAHIHLRILEAIRERDDRAIAHLVREHIFFLGETWAVDRRAWAADLPAFHQEGAEQLPLAATLGLDPIRE